ncbi:hypothetical protein IV203_035192 [Nitzschia inconspicua]|uniref:Uncharacterized protein n=1 Tax=Nitzschia inconspicua TaxID=303405 RepID=A0A9K3LEJ1_9STRA|nr:hypothetical protein IV203_035192 [Nitzschia inconspicua]
MSPGLEGTLRLEVIEVPNAPVGLFQPSLGPVLIIFSMSGFVSDVPFLVAVFPHEADNVTGPREAVVLVLDLNVIPFQGGMPFAMLWIRAGEEMFEIFDGIIAGWAHTGVLDLFIYGDNFSHWEPSM